MSYIPDVRGTEEGARLHQQELEADAARHELAAEAKRDRHDADPEPRTLLMRLLTRLRGGTA